LSSTYEALKQNNSIPAVDLMLCYSMCKGKRLYVDIIIHFRIIVLKDYRILAIS